MNWKQWIIIIILAFEALASIATVGREREPLEPYVAAINTALIALLIWLVVTI